MRCILKYHWLRSLLLLLLLAFCVILARNKKPPPGPWVEKDVLLEGIDANSICTTLLNIFIRDSLALCLDVDNLQIYRIGQVSCYSIDVIRQRLYLLASGPTTKYVECLAHLLEGSIQTCKDIAYEVVRCNKRWAWMKHSPNTSRWISSCNRNKACVLFLHSPLSTPAYKYAIPTSILYS